MDLSAAYLWIDLGERRTVFSMAIRSGTVKTDFFRNSENIKAHDNMLMPKDVASQIMFALKTPANFHNVNLEIRPLKPRG